MNGSVRVPVHRARCFAPSDEMQSGRTAARNQFAAAIRVGMPFVSAITLLLVITAPARATTTVEFEGIGSFTTTVLAHQGVTVTGSNNIYVHDLNGLGIVGGFSDVMVDSSEDEYGFVYNESITLDVGSESTIFNVRFGTIGGFGTHNTMIEAFDDSGSLGTQTYDLAPLCEFGCVPLDVPSVFGVSVVSKVTLTALNTNLNDVGTWFSIRSLTIPEPSTALLLGIGLTALGIRRRRYTPRQ